MFSYLRFMKLAIYCIFFQNSLFGRSKCIFVGCVLFSMDRLFQRSSVCLFFFCGFENVFWGLVSICFFRVSSYSGFMFFKDTGASVTDMISI